MRQKIRRMGHHGSAVLTVTTSWVLFVLLGVPAPATGVDVAVGRPASGETGDTRKLAEALVQRAGIRRGVCSVLGRDGNVAIDIVRSSELLVHVREPRAAEVAELRKEAEGIPLRRLVIEQGPLDRLPFADNMVDIVISTQGVPASLKVEEILRCLRPGGMAVLGKARPTEEADAEIRKLKEWAARDGGANIRASADGSGAWIQFRKPALEGADDWSHWEHGPDNNPVSLDQVIKAPYMTQFLAKPFYIGMPSVTTAAGGRTFLAIGHIAHHRREWDLLQTLIARNGYNGTVLWKRKLPEGYLVHRSAFIATDETFYMIDGEGCLLLDPLTGKEKGRIRIPGVEGDWKWMALKEGTLYVLAGKPGPGAETTLGDRTFGGWSWGDLSKGYYGKRIPFGFGDTLAAYDIAGKKPVWTHREETLIDSRGMAMGGGKLFLYCPDRRIRALNSATGQVAWTNGEREVIALIEKPGKGLTSTPGFRTACLAVFTPRALIIQGQTRMNVVGVSTADGSLLWRKKKITNNPNAIFVDEKVVLGVGPGGSHVAIEPATGEILDDLKFRKVACTRLTASTDSFFCRGEGTLRYDRYFKKVLVDGAARPACNDGALPANGMLYIGPWQCDCNLSLIGALARCSAGEFRFDHLATEATRLHRGEGAIDTVTDFPVSAEDWPTYRGSNRRGGGARVRVGREARHAWEYTPEQSHLPTAPTAAGDLVFVSGEDGRVRALDGVSGKLRWTYATSGPVKYPPTIWEGRAYVGSGDGFVYALEAATGRLLWRFRAAPVERHIMVYGALTSTWPVSSGVLVDDGVAYFAAGIIDHDGTYVYALDARTGKIRWQNNSSGHLSKELRKGVSVQGNLTVQGDRLLLAGGNQVSPAAYNLESGRCLARPFGQGRPKANAGRFIGVFQDGSLILGGRVLYSAAENVSTKGSFAVLSRNRGYTLNSGGIPPAWDEDTMALVNFMHGKILCCDARKVAAQIKAGLPGRRRPDRRRSILAQALQAAGAVRWQSDLGTSNKFEAVSLCICPNAVVAVVRSQQGRGAQAKWFVVALNKENGQPLFRRELQAEPLPGGLLVDRRGQVIVTTVDGRVICVKT